MMTDTLREELHEKALMAIEYHKSFCDEKQKTYEQHFDEEWLTLLFLKAAYSPEKYTKADAKEFDVLSEKCRRGKIDKPNNATWIWANRKTNYRHV